MEEQGEGQGQGSSPRQGGSERSSSSEPVRSRWTPKPEQILILESIFNSGMVNPPKEETVRIRKLLEKFGSVGDANVFYWFQNRRSRSRRRQRQMQAASLDPQPPPSPPPQLQLGGAIPYHCDNTHTHSHNASSTPPPPPLPITFPAATVSASASPSFPDFSAGSSSSSCGILAPQEALDAALFSPFSPSPHMGFPQVDHASPPSSLLYPPDASTFNFHSGLITVFINGVATEVPRGPMDIKTMFGQDVVLVHSSGVPLPTNDFGFLMQSLQHGESYFLVSKQT